MEENKEMKLEVKAEVARGSYSNLAIISHSHSEFVVDFATILPGMPKPDITNRIILTPEHAKRLMAALNDNIMKYESLFGRIELDQNPKGTFNLGDFQNNGTKS